MGNWINERRMSGTRKESGEGKEISRTANNGVETVVTGWLGQQFSVEQTVHLKYGNQGVGTDMGKGTCNALHEG